MGALTARPDLRGPGIHHQHGLKTLGVFALVAGVLVAAMVAGLTWTVRRNPDALRRFRLRRAAQAAP